jgi:hypothetical protein
MRETLFFSLVILLLSSCFHKDVMSDRADDVASAFIYNGPEGKWIITKEQVFQAQSKESGGGVTQISGYAEYRLTAYDPATGQQTGRVNMGEGIEKSFTILGTTPGKLWLFSIDPELGFHCRNPKTLELISDEKTLTASGSLKGFAFARPEWMKLNQQYGWSAANEKLMLSDMQGYHYYFDPEKNTLEKTEDPIIDYTWAVSKTGSTGYFTKENYVSLRSDGRQKLMYNYEDSTGKFSYLNGEILLDVNPAHDAVRKKNALMIIDNEEKMLKDSIARIHALFPKISVEGRSYSELSNEEWKAKNKCESMMRHIESLERDKESINRENSKYIDNPVMSDAAGNLFIIHGSDVTDTSRMQLSKVNLSGRTFTETWTIKLADFYRDPEKANTKGAFETVFSDGNPNFRFQWFDIADDKLFMISQLQMVCVDVKSGKTLWVHPL